MRIDGAQIPVVVVIPYLIEDLAAAQSLAGIAHQIVEKLVFRRTEIDILPVEDDLAGIAVDGDTGFSFLRFRVVLRRRKRAFILATKILG